MAHDLPRIEPYVDPEDREGLLVSTPWSPRFLEELKAQVPYPFRSWLPGSKAWFVAEEYEDILRHLLARHFGDIAEADEHGNVVITTARGERLSQGGLGL